jgi:hypothetical protein
VTGFHAPEDPDPAADPYAKAAEALSVCAAGVSRALTLPPEDVPRVCVAAAMHWLEDLVTSYAHAREAGRLKPGSSIDAAMKGQIRKAATDCKQALEEGLANLGALEDALTEKLIT